MATTVTDAPALLTLREVAARLAVSEQTVRRLVRAGKLPHVRVGFQLRVAPDALEAWLDRGGH